MNRRIVFLTLFLAVISTQIAFSEDSYFFPIEAHGLWGYVDVKGKIVMKPSFQAAAHFAEGLAPVKIGSSFGYID